VSIGSMRYTVLWISFLNIPLLLVTGNPAFKMVRSVIIIIIIKM